MPVAVGGMRIVRKPRSAHLLHKVVRDEVKKRLEPIAERHVRSRQEVVANWRHRPDFGKQIRITPDTIMLTITIRNRNQSLGEDSDATIGDLWKWLDQTGTKPHRIPKEGVTLLAFQWGGPGSYISKTGAAPARHSGPGIVRNAKDFFAFSIEHPGFPPRHFSEDINRDLKRPFDNAVNAAYRAGLKKIARK